MSEEVEVTVTVPDPPPVEESKDPEVIVVVEQPEEAANEAGPTDLELGVLLGQLAARVDTIEAGLAAVAEQTSQAGQVAEAALEVADAAGQTAVEVAEETATDAELEEIVEDVPPIGRHWFFQTASELRRGGN